MSLRNQVIMPQQVYVQYSLRRSLADIAFVGVVRCGVEKSRVSVRPPACLLMDDISNVVEAHLT